MTYPNQALWKVAAFGSCRVQTPLSIANAQGYLSFKAHNGIGYIHNPLEIAQAIALLKGDVAAPRELYRLLNVVNPKLLGSPDHYAEVFEAADAIVIEISSVRIIEDGPWQLQIHRFREEAEKRGAPSKLMSKIFDPSQRPHVMSTIEACGWGEFFTGRRFYELDAHGLSAALRSLRSKIHQPVLFVGTIRTDFNGAIIPQREMTHLELDRIANEVPNTSYFDPTPVLTAVGARRVMKDLGHYTEEFEPVIAQHLSRAISTLCARPEPGTRLENQAASVSA